MLTIIDVAALVRGATKPGAQIKRAHDAESHAIVCEIGGHGHRILVDRVDDIQTIESAHLTICGRIEPAWQTFAWKPADRPGDPSGRFLLSGRR